MLKAKIIAFYLPQYHPIPENDEWWGTGFTEWTNVCKAKPLFRGHYQPKIPADLGYYDLRLPEIREAQAKMAKDAGVYGFCYWHYWFGNGKRLLERPFNEVLLSGKPNFPFCLGWANESWEAKVWNSKSTTKNKVLIEQQYLGKEDNELHFYSMLQAFKDSRYITIDKKPLFLIYKPFKYKEIDEFIEQWNNLAKINGIEKGFYFVAHTENFKDYHDLINKGFDAITISPISRAVTNYYLSKSKIHEIIDKVKSKFFRMPIIINYKNAYQAFVNKNEDTLENVIPTILPNWDHSSRSGKNAWILHNSTPQLFKNNIKNALECTKNKDEEHNIIFLKSWNEWGEGNYMEPDLKYKHGYIDALRSQILEHQ